MKVVDQVLKPDTIQNVYEELNSKKKTECWRSANLFWSPNILVQIDGDCVSTSLSSTVASQIESDISWFLPPYGSLTMYLYLWGKHSGISLHNDVGHLFGATIYLNQEWNIHNGGLFLWKPQREDPDDAFQLIVPKFNRMVVNGHHAPHLVTPVSSHATEHRITIQIWGQESSTVS